MAPTKILLQTTIPTTADDWSISRFHLLSALLASIKGETGDPAFEVTARDRDPPGAPDSVLSGLDQSDFGALWLFAVDTGDGLTSEDCAAISRFRKQGGGLMVTRDHMDLGSSVCTLGGIGAAHYFHSKHFDPEAERNAIDDPDTPEILWPNYHSGANGDFQEITPAGDLHPLLSKRGDRVRYLPAHPHEGGVGAPPDDPSARVIATGISQSTGRPFNIAVAFEASEAGGRAVAQSTFHHFADYNWDPSQGCPSFVSEKPGHGLQQSPAAGRSLQQYIRNLALWLVNRPLDVETQAHLDDELDEALDETFPASDPTAVG